MKKNAALREFKKLKSQINQIEEIVHHSKVGALIEQETSIRKKIRVLKEMEKEGFKEYEDVCERYEELLEEASKRMLEDYNKKNNTDFDFYEVVRGNYNTFLNSGVMTVLTKQHIPKLIGEAFEEAFPDNPKDEYMVTRRMKRKIYGAYGSNMNLEQMAHRCPKAKVIGSGILQDYKLTFSIVQETCVEFSFIISSSPVIKSQTMPSLFNLS